MMLSEKKWMIVVVKGPKRQHVGAGEPQSTRREAWQSCLDRYAERFNDNKDSRQGYDLFHEQVRKGHLRAVKVTISWESAR